MRTEPCSKDLSVRHKTIYNSSTAHSRTWNHTISREQSKDTFRLNTIIHLVKLVSFPSFPAIFIIPVKKDYQ